MSGITSEITRLTGKIDNPQGAMQSLYGLLLSIFQPRVESLQEDGRTINYVRYLMVPELIMEREFIFGNKRILLYVGDEEGELMVDFKKYPKASYILLQDVTAGQEIMIINVALMARTVCIPDGEPFDINELEFTGPDFMLSTIEAFVRGDIKFTYPGNIDRKT